MHALVRFAVRLVSAPLGGGGNRRCPARGSAGTSLQACLRAGCALVAPCHVSGILRTQGSSRSRLGRARRRMRSRRLVWRSRQRVRAQVEDQVWRPLRLLRPPRRLQHRRGATCPRWPSRVAAISTQRWRLHLRQRLGNLPSKGCMLMLTHGPHVAPGTRTSGLGRASIAPGSAARRRTFSPSRRSRSTQ